MGETEKKNGQWIDKVRVVDGGELSARGDRPDLVRQEAAPVSVDAARVVSETQAMIVMARSKPRDYLSVRRAVQTVCARPRFAEKATFRFPRGGTQVHGPSIRMMEALVTAYTNVDAGWRVLETEGNTCRVEAYAWDLENNTRKRVEFWVRMARDSGGQVVDVTSERDRYEVVASAAQRRVRACIANLLPFDLIDEAMELCESTLKAGDGSKPLKDRVADMVLAFEVLGVNRSMIEGLLGHAVELTIVDELPRMREIYNSLNEGHARREDFFDLSLAGAPPARPAPPAPTPTAAPASPTPAPAEGTDALNAAQLAEFEAMRDRARIRAAELEKGGADPTAVKVGPAAATEPATAPAPETPPASDAQPALFKILLGRLHNTYKMTDEQIHAELGGPIDSAPVEELEALIERVDRKRADRRRTNGDTNPAAGNGGQGALDF